MLKPVETLSIMREDFRFSEHDIEWQQTKLIEALTISSRNQEIKTLRLFLLMVLKR